MLSFDDSRCRNRSASSQKPADARQQGRKHEQKDLTMLCTSERVSPNSVMLLNLDDSSFETSSWDASPQLNPLYHEPTSFVLGPYDEAHTIYMHNHLSHYPRRLDGDREEGARSKRLFCQQHSSMNDLGGDSPGLRWFHTRSDSSRFTPASQTKRQYKERYDAVGTSRAFCPARSCPKRNSVSLCEGDNNSFRRHQEHESWKGGESGDSVAQRFQKTKEFMNCNARYATKGKDNQSIFHGPGSSPNSADRYARGADEEKDLIGPPKIKNIWRNFAESCTIHGLQSPCGSLFSHSDNLRTPNMRGLWCTTNYQDEVLVDQVDTESRFKNDRLRRQRPGEGTTEDTFLSSRNNRRHAMQLRESSSCHNPCVTNKSHVSIISEEQTWPVVRLRVGLPSKSSSVDSQFTIMGSKLNSSRQSVLQSLPYHNTRVKDTLCLVRPKTDVMIAHYRSSQLPVDIFDLRAEILKLQVELDEACAERLSSEKEKERVQRERDEAMKEARDLKSHVCKLSASMGGISKFK